MKNYNPSTIEPKWRNKWAEDKLYTVNLGEAKKPYYLLVEFTYPSGDLHIGHWFSFAVPDILGRMKRMQGFDVFFPNGFDAFGLPAENAAIKNGGHPKDWTLANIDKMRQQFSLMGAIHDWEHSVITCEPDYYKWNQWIFLKMLEKGLAYKGKFLSNWCPNDQTVLANENVENGRCWRCGAEVIQRQVEQWFLKITDYADQLLWSDEPKVNWPKPIREGQNNWIGRSEGILLRFKAAESEAEVEVFTTAIDTVFGVTFLVISPENSLLAGFVTDEQKEAVDSYIKSAKKKSELERKESKEKTGVFTGGYVINPLNGDRVPVWVADYVLAGYGTGAVMGVPGHDARDHEFAQKFGLKIVPVIKPTEGVKGAQVKEDGFWDYPEIKTEFATKSILFDSGGYSGLTSKEAKEKISDYIENNNLGKRQIQYHLHDWSISRQRYWGTPIPVINCPKCGVVPVPEKDLPVELPYKVDYTPKGKSPLATAEEWIKVKCPNCGGEATREDQTMDTFVDSSWYFLRYLDPKNDTKIADFDIEKKWLPINIYFGGAEHTLGHTLYSRFFYKFLVDIGVVLDPSGLKEYAAKRVHHGVILGPDGSRMSKSRGNVINPDEQVKNFGADAVRLYLSFLGPYDIVAPWNPGGIKGVYNFLQRVWNLQEKVINDKRSLRSKDLERLTINDLKIMHKTIKKVTEEVSEIKFNTAVAGLMEWLNYLVKKERVSLEEYKTLLIILAPFAPHITEELWSILGMDYSIHQQSWPEFDSKYLESSEFSLVVQINGKVRDTIKIQKDVESSEKDIEKIALSSSKIQKFINGQSVKKTIYVPGKLINFVI